MPRTKQVRTAEKPKESLVSYKDTEATSNFEEFVDTYELKKVELLEDKNARLAAYRLEMKQDRIAIPVSVLNKKIKELKQGNISVWQNLSTLSFSVMSSALAPRNISNATKNSLNDEGYLTSESSTGTSGGRRQTKASKRSSSVSKIDTSAPAKKKSSRTSRSLSRSKLPEAAAVAKKQERSSRSLTRNLTTHSTVKSENKFRTPQNTRRIDNFGTVTPKMKPNTPHVVLRRPQQGEIAISLQGSPLMTTAMVTETTANLNIPLPDGRLINIQPRKGLRPSEIPELDPDIQLQLQTLRENLDKVCQFNSRK